jgi:hypothetical protein
MVVVVEGEVRVCVEGIRVIMVVVVKDRHVDWAECP